MLGSMQLAVNKPFLSGLKPTQHISHRGGSLLAPENTIAAFEMSVIQYQTDMLELDVHRTRDGKLVVSHDPTVNRCTNGRGAIREMSCSEIQSLDAGFHFTDASNSHPFRGRGVAIPLLTEVLDRFRPLRVNVDVKTDEPEIESLFAETVRGCCAVNRICCGSESDPLAFRLLQKLPEACHFFPRDAATSFILAVKSGESPVLSDDYTVLDIPYQFEGIDLVDEELLSAATHRNLWVNVWTVDEEPTMEKLVALGVGGIITDRPDRLRAVLNRTRRAGSAR